MEKKEALLRWKNLAADQQILPHFTPIPAEAKGSTFGACGIRISGNPDFVDAVLSRLKDLLAAEAGNTRLVLSRQPVKSVTIKDGDKTIDKKWNNADENAETCYIQIRERTARTCKGKGVKVVPLEELPMFPKDDAEGKKSDADGKNQDADVRTVAHIGGLSTGEVLWEEETEENAVEEGKKW